MNVPDFQTSSLGLQAVDTIAPLHASVIPPQQRDKTVVILQAVYMDMQDCEVAILSSI